MLPADSPQLAEVARTAWKGERPFILENVYRLWRILRRGRPSIGTPAVYCYLILLFLLPQRNITANTHNDKRLIINLPLCMTLRNMRKGGINSTNSRPWNWLGWTVSLTALSFRPNGKRLHWPLTLYLLTWRIWWALTNASKGQVGFNSAFKGLNRELGAAWKRYRRFEESLALPALGPLSWGCAALSLDTIMTRTIVGNYLRKERQKIRPCG
jgi:hypothetical protein